MYEKVYSNPDIYKIFVPLPRNPLKNLNCYVVKTPGRALVIDTGFNQPECLEALIAGLKELSVDMDSADLFITHLHSDHSGLVNAVAKPGTTIRMGKKDYEILRNYLCGDHWERMDKRFLKEGFTSGELEILDKKNPAKNLACNGCFDAETLEDGDKFTVGDYEFTAVFTPGHTPGHTCLYMEKEKIMFLGDHVLYDITPNITMWLDVEDSLGSYIESLKKIKTFDVSLALPAHRENDMNLYDRIDAILNHHKSRLMDSYNIIKSRPGLCAYEIAGHMSWDIVCNSWEDFPITQKWFAVGEAISHLDYLSKRGYVETRLDKNGINRYYLVKETAGSLF